MTTPLRSFTGLASRMQPLRGRDEGSRRGRRRRRLEGLEWLEARCLLAITPSLSGTTVLFSGGPGDQLFVRTNGGLLEYKDGPGGTYSSDLDPSGGTQTLSTSQDITIDAASIATMTVESFQGLGGGVTVVDLPTVEISANLDTQGGSLSITASKSVTVDAGVWVSTRRTGGGNPSVAPSTGNSGGLTFDSPAIALNQGSALYAQVEAGSPFAAGDVVLTADDTAIRELQFLSAFNPGDNFDPIGTLSSLAQIGVFRKTATITMTGATVKGDTITVTTDAADLSLSSVLAPYVAGLVDAFYQELSQLPGIVISQILGISAQVNLRTSHADVSLTNTTVAGNAVVITNQTAADASLHTVAMSRPGSPVAIAVGYGQASARSRTTIAGSTITGQDSVTIQTTAQSTADVRARVSANLTANGDGINRNQTAFSVAVANTTTEATTSIDAGSTIASPQGNVSIASDGTVDNEPWAQPMVFKDGIAGIGIALSFDHSTVDTQVDGTVRARGIDNLVFNPGTAVSTANSTITIPGNGLSDGQLITYSAGGGTPIGGLTDGAKYYVKTLDPNTFQLTTGRGLELVPTADPPAVQHTVARRAIQPFTPGNVNAGNDTIAVAGQPFTEGQRVTYFSNTGGNIDGLVNNDAYLVHVVDASTIQLLDPITNAVVPIAPGSASGTHMLQYEQAAESFSPNTAVNGATGAITLPNHGYTTGDAVVYNVDPNATTQVPLVQYEEGPGGTLTTTTLGNVTVPNSPIGGLDDGVVYFVVVLDANHIQLATSLAQAQGAATPVALTSVGTGTTHSIETGETAGIGIAAGLDATAELTVDAELTGQDLDWTTAFAQGAVDLDFLVQGIRQIPSYLQGFKDTFQGGQEDPVDQNGTESKFALAGGFGVNFFTHTVTAEVGGTAVLESMGDTQVEAAVTQATQLYVGASSAKAEGDTAKLSVAVAVGIGLYTNTVEATIEGGARVDSKGTLTVSTDLSYPFLSTDPTASIDPAKFFANSGPEGWADLFDGTLGYSSDFFNTWALTSADSGKVSGGGSIVATIYDNTSTATIGAGAQINQRTDADFRSGPQAVSVQADTTIQLLEVTGIASINITPGGVQDALAKGQSISERLANLFNPLGANGDKGAIGASVLFDKITNTTTATIAGGARVYTNPTGAGLVVAAEQTIFSFALAQSGAKASEFGLGASLAGGILDTTTTASIGTGAIVRGGPVDVDATDTLFRTAIAGGVMIAENLAVGLSIAMHLITRNTYAYIGASESSPPGTGGTDISVQGAVTVDAEATGKLWSFAIAATAAMPSNNPGPPQPNEGGDPLGDFELEDFSGQAEPGGGVEEKSGISIAGDVGFTILRETTHAYVNDKGSIQAPSITVKAHDDAEIWTASGAGALSTTGGGSATSLGIAGSLSSNVVIANTQAFVAGATLTTPALTVAASREGFIRSFTGGGSADPLPSGVAIAGSVSVNLVLTETAAYLSGVTGTLAGPAAISSADDSEIGAIAGAASFGGRAGVGAAIAVNLIGYSNRTDLVPNRRASSRAYVDDSTLAFTSGGLTLTATNGADTDDYRILVVAGALGLGKLSNGIGVAGMVAVNLIKDDTEAAITDSTVTGAAGIDLSAEDRSKLLYLGGAIGGAGNVGVGAGLGYNQIENNTLAYVEGSQLNSNSGVSLEAVQSALLVGATLGVGAGVGSGGFAGAGAGSVNLINNTIDAHISKQANVTATAGDVSLVAADRSEMVSVAGGVAGAGNGAIGAGVSYNLIGNTLTTKIDDSTVTAQAGDVSLESLASPLLIAVAVGGAGASSFAIGGSLTINVITNSVAALVSNGSNVSASGDVTLTATEGTTMYVVAGGLAVSTSGFAVGAAIGYNFVGSGFDPAAPVIDPNANRDASVDNAVTAAIDGSTVHAGGDLTLATGFAAPAQSYPSSVDLGVTTIALPVAITTQITTVTVGGSGADGFAFGGAVSINFLHNSAETRITGLAASQSVTAGGTIALDATDASTLNSGAGGIAISVEGGAVGAAVAYNDIANTLIARVGSTKATDTTGGNLGTVSAATVDVQATSNARIRNVTFAGSGGAVFAGAGSIGLNRIGNTVDAHVANSASVAGSTQVNLGATDTSTIQALSGQLSGSGTAGIGVALAYNQIANTVSAYAANATLSSTGGSIALSATATPEIETIAAGLLVSTVSIAGSSAANLLENTVEAYLQNTTATAHANVTVIAETDNTIRALAGTGDGALAVGIDGTVVVNEMKNTTRASIGGGSKVTASGLGGTVDVPQWTVDSSGNETRTQQAIRGLAVVATTGESLEVVAVTVAITPPTGEGTVAFGANVIVNLAGDTTSATIDDSDVNSAGAPGQSVIVRAHQTTDIRSGGGTVTTGDVAVAAAVDTEILTSTITAAITDSNAATANRVFGGAGVEVHAQTWEKIKSIAVGASVATYAALAGAGTAVKTTTATAATIQGTSVTTGGDLEVEAEARIEVEYFNGTVAGSAFVGFGGAFSVGLIGHTTTATIRAATTHSDGDTTVSARTTEHLPVLVGTAGVGGIAGIAGAVTYLSSATATTATIEGGSGTADVTAGGAVSVTAEDTTTIDAKAGSLAISGGAAAGASVNVVIVKNTVGASIQGATTVHAAGAVEVSATAMRDVRSVVVAFGGGLSIGITGAVSVVTIGIGLDATGASQSSAMQNSVNSTISPAGGIGGLNTSTDDPVAGQARTAANAGLFTISVTPDGTTAGTEAMIGSGTTVISDSGDISVEATETLTQRSIAGGAAIGLAGGVGGSVAILNLGSGTEAQVEDGATLSAGGDVSVEATFTAGPVSSGDPIVAAYGGAAGLVGGLGAQVALVTDTSQQAASLGASATTDAAGAAVERAGHVVVAATGNLTLETKAENLSVAGGLAAGAAVSQVTRQGSTRANVGDHAQIGQGSGPVNSLSVAASNTITLDAEGHAVSAGVIAAGDLNKGTASLLAPADGVTPSLEATIGDGAKVRITHAGGVSPTDPSDIHVAATMQADVSVDMTGVAGGGGLTVGATLTDATASPTVAAAVGDGAVLVAGADVIVEAVQATANGVNATGGASGGSLFNGDGVNAQATAATTVGGSVGASTIQTGGNVTIRAVADNQAIASGTSASGGAANVQRVIVGATASGSNANTPTLNAPTQAVLAAGARVTAAGLRIEADGTSNAQATTDLSGGGVFNDSGNPATATAMPYTFAGIADATSAAGAAVVNATNAVTIAAQATPNASATVTRHGGGVIDVDTSTATVTLSPTIEARLGAFARVDAGTDVNVTAVQGEAAPSFSNGSFNTSQVSGNTIDFQAPHGLATGDAIGYDDQADQIPSNTPIGGLGNGRNYNAIVTGPNTIQLGVSYEGSAVDLIDDVLVFPGGHNLETGDRVELDLGGASAFSYRLANGTVVTATDGQVFFVRALDEQRIKLGLTPAAVTSVPAAFQPGTTITGAGTFHLPGFANGQAVTYNAPETLIFQRQAISASVIDLKAPSGLVNGQPLLYSANGTPIGGLVPGTTYYAIVLDAERFQLSATVDAGGNPGPAVGLDPSTAYGGQVLAGIALPGLESGRTYYVVGATATTFEIALTPGGTALAVPAAGVRGFHSIGVEGLDLVTNGSGTQNLILPLTPPANQSQRFSGIGGANSYATGSSVATANASAMGAGLGSGVGAYSTTTIATQASAGVGSSARVSAGRDVNISSTSFANGVAIGSSDGSGFVGEGRQEAYVTIDHSNETAIASGARIDAGRDLAIVADSSILASTSASSDGGGVYEDADTRAAAQVSYDTSTTVNAGAQLTAGADLDVTTRTSVNAQVDTDSEGSGLGVDSYANDDSGKGVLIGVDPSGSQVQAFTVTEIGAGAVLRGNQVAITAVVPLLEGNATSTSESKALGADTTSRSNVEVNDLVQVLVDAGAQVFGTATIVVQALHYDPDTGASSLNLVSDSDATCKCAGGKTDADANTDVESVSEVDAAAGALFTTPQLLVQSLTFVEAYARNAHRHHDFIDFGGTSKSGSLDAARNIQFDADVNTEAGAEALLVIDANGVVTQDENVSYTETATAFVVDDIANLPSNPHAIQFVANQVDNVATANASGDGVIRGTQSTFHFGQTLSSVKLLNASTKSLVVNGIAALNGQVPSQPSVVIDVKDDGSGTDFGFAVTYGFGATLVEIANSGAAGDPDIVLQGLIDNPVGTTRITNTRGDILATATGIVRTNVLEISAAIGVAGSAVQPLNLEVVEVVDNAQGDLPISVRIDGAAGVDVGLTGRLRGPDANPAATPFVVPIERIHSGSGIQARVHGALWDNVPFSDAVGIEVVEVYIPKTTFVTTQFRPPQNQPPLNVPAPGFETGAVPIGSTYRFDDLTSVGNIELDGTPGTPILNLIGTTTVTGTGLISADTNGDITLTETSGTFRVGTIASSAGNVVLTATDTPSAGDDLIVGAGRSVVAAGTILMRAGDDMTLAATGLIQAGSSVTIRGDFGDVDPPVGAIVDLRGTIRGTSALITTEGGHDVVSLTNVSAGTPTTVLTRDGNDRIHVGSNATPTSNTGGTLDRILAALMVDGGPPRSIANGAGDRLSLDDSAKTTPTIGVLTDTTVAGLSPGLITYLDIEYLDITLGTAADQFTIQSTHPFHTNLDANAGNDTIRVVSASAAATANTHIDGDTGQDLIVGPDVASDWHITAFNAGFVLGASPFNFVAVENLTGGSNDDDFILADQQGLDGKLDGGAGKNCLDYQAYTTPVVVDLATGRATNIFHFQAGGVRNIGCVFGPCFAPSLLIGDDLPNTLVGCDFPDTIIGNGAGDSLVGGGGDDVILGDSGTYSVQRIEIRDAPEHPSVLFERLLYDPRRDQIRWSRMMSPVVRNVNLITLDRPTVGGNDTIVAGAGNDAVHGGPGDDLIQGDAGRDALFGNAGNDRLFGGTEDDRLYGGADNDSLDGGLGTDIAFGGLGTDRLTANVATDRLLDWSSLTDVFVVPPGVPTGPPVVLKQTYLANRLLLFDLATFDGSTDPNTELALFPTVSGATILSSSSGPVGSKDVILGSSRTSNVMLLGARDPGPAGRATAGRSGAVPRGPLASRGRAKPGAKAADVAAARRPVPAVLVRSRARLARLLERLAAQRAGVASRAGTR